MPRHRLQADLQQTNKAVSSMLPTTQTKTRHQLTTFSWLVVVLEADSSYEEWKEPLNGGRGSRECVANKTIPPQSRPEATLLLAGKVADEMLHKRQCQCFQQWYSKISRRALQHLKTVGKELTV